jgi:hypothetical protein
MLKPDYKRGSRGCVQTCDDVRSLSDDSIGSLLCTRALGTWPALSAMRIRSVAMESTSVYWIPVYQIMEDRGLEVYLVNSRHVKNVPGRETDVSDCQWLQYLHSVGLLRASFRPPGVICAIRTL